MTEQITLKELMETKELTSTFQPIPRGIYGLTVVGTQVREPRVKDDGTMTRPSVRVQFAVSEGEYANRRIFRSFVVGEQGSRSLGMVLGTYRRLVGHGLGDDMPGDDLDPLDIAVTFAEGIKGGMGTAKIGVSPKRNADGTVDATNEENTFQAWVDE